MRGEARTPLDPEMQAELEFGILQSDEVDFEGALENLRVFLAQGEAWQDVDEDILSLRSKKNQASFPGVDELQKVVKYEIDYIYSLWSGDMDGAHTACERILDQLRNPALTGYRAWWNYCAGSACWASVKKGAGILEPQARRYFRQAVNDARFVSWLSDLAVVYGEPDNKTKQTPPEVTQMLERIEERFIELGTSSPRKYNAEEKAILEGLSDGDADRFEDAQRRLGLLLGFIAGNSNDQGAPDPWWQLDSKHCVVFEDHSDAKPGSCLDAKKARQVALHPNWLRDKQIVSAECEVQSVLVTPVTRTEGAARPHLGDFSAWPLHEFQACATEALATLRRIRREFNDRGDLAWRANTATALESAGLLPADIWHKVCEKTGADVLTG